MRAILADLVGFAGLLLIGIAVLVLAGLWWAVLFVGIVFTWVGIVVHLNAPSPSPPDTEGES